MKLNEITETGFYTGELDNKREIIYEVINNTDEEWLKETPEQKLLIDEWTYEYTDEDNRKHYEIYGGNLVAVVNAEPIDVIKITDTKYTMDVSDPTIASKCNGTAMMEDKPTRLEIVEQQLKRKEQECERLKNNRRCAWKSLEGTLCPEAQEQLDQLKKENEELKGIRDRNFLHALEEQKKADKLKQTLTEIKEIAQYNVYTSRTDLCIKLNWVKKKISEVLDE